MAFVMIQYRVRDYATWRTVFDANEARRRANGVTNARVYRNEDDPNDIVPSIDVADVEKTRTRLEGPEMREIWNQAGVIGKPVVVFSERAPA